MTARRGEERRGARTTLAQVLIQVGIQVASWHHQKEDRIATAEPSIAPPKKPWTKSMHG